MNVCLVLSLFYFITKVVPHCSSVSSLLARLEELSFSLHCLPNNYSSNDPFSGKYGVGSNIPNTNNNSHNNNSSQNDLSMTQEYNNATDTTLTNISNEDLNRTKESLYTNPNTSTVDKVTPVSIKPLESEKQVESLPEPVERGK